MKDKQMKQLKIDWEELNKKIEAEIKIEVEKMLTKSKGGKKT